MSGSNTAPEASAELSIRYMDAETARFISDAISPDNLQAPVGISVEARAEGSELRVSVTCSRGLGSLVSTLDDLLSCVQAAERAISEVKKQ